MKVSLNSIKFMCQRYGCADNLIPDGVNELVEKIGAQLGAVEEVIDLGKKYQGIIIAKVVNCQKLEGSDHLSVCKIDDGGVVKNVERVPWNQDLRAGGVSSSERAAEEAVRKGTVPERHSEEGGNAQKSSRVGGSADEQDGRSHGLVQVVCGAPNCREGLTVAWLPPGTTVPESVGKDPFVLEAREIRGVRSNGMLASLRELGISDDHSGILEIDGEVKPGTDFAEQFEMAGDVIIDIENKMFTHRPDCFGFLGVAREIAGIQHQPFKSPDWYNANAVIPTEVEESAKDLSANARDDNLKLEVINELPELCPRFTAIAMSNVQVGPSPTRLQVLLGKLGQKSINNVVDLTNYYMLLTGQPLHAYDYDKVKALSAGDAAKIVVRHPKAGENIKLLNGKEVEPRKEAIMIATDKQVIGIGGVMGGSETEVDTNTKIIIIECANFDMYSIRRTSMEHGLFTDAVTRFTKGQSPLQCLAVLAKIVDEVKKGGGQVASAVVDVSQLEDRQTVHPSVKASSDFVNDRLGLKLSVGEMKQLLENVEFKVDVAGGELTVAAPFWRTDIEIPEDIVEEVGRLYGYDKLPLELPGRSIRPAEKDELLELKSKIRTTLAKAGANEVLTYSFVHGDLLEKVGQDPKNAFQVANALSPDLQYYRLSLMPSLLEKVHANIKAGYDEFALFELGKSHLVDELDDEGLPREDELAALVVASADKLKKPGAAYYEAKKYLEALVKTELTYKPVPEAMQKYDITKPFDMSRSAFVYGGETFVGLIGEFRPSVTRSLKLPKYCAGFELDTAALKSFVAKEHYEPLPRFPKVTQDITFKVSTNMSYQKLYTEASASLNSNKPRNTSAILSPLGIYQSKEDASHKHITLRLTIASYERTLTDTEVAKLLDSVAVAAKEKLTAERI